MSASDSKHLRVKEVNGVAVVDFVDAPLMFASAVVEEIGDELGRLVTDGGHTKILLDFTHVQYLSSAMAAQLVKFERQVKQAHGRLALYGLGPVLMDALRMGHLDSLFSIYDDDESAIGSF